MANPRRDQFPNHFVGDLVPTDRGWVVVPPTCCPDGHSYADPGWKAPRSGAAAVIATWNGDAIAAQPFTHRSRDRTAESATEAPSRPQQLDELDAIQVSVLPGLTMAAAPMDELLDERLAHLRGASEDVAVDT